MTRDEFQVWLQHHGSCYFGLEAAISKACVGQNAPTRAQVLGRWFHTLASVELQDAIEASNLMHQGAIEEPKGFDRHPAAIREAAKRLARMRGVGTVTIRPRWFQGEETFACLACRDAGVRFIWHPLSVTAAIEGRFGKPFTVYEAVVACTCKAGDYRANRQQWPRFDLANHCELTRWLTLHEQQPALMDWLEKRKPANYEPAFAEFGG